MRFKILGAVLLFGGLVQSSFGSIYSPPNCTVPVGPTACTFDGTGTLTVAGTAITWNSDAAGSAAQFFTFSGGTPAGVFGTIPNGAQEGIANLGLLPVGTTFGAIPFFTFPVGGLPGLNLTFIQQGQYLPTLCATSPGTAAAGQTCTPPVPIAGLPPGPFSFVNFLDPNFGLSSNATFSFSGIAAGDPGVRWSAIFTSQFIGQSFQNVLAGASITNAYSVAVTLVSVPEPGTGLLVIGSGLIGLAALLRRRTAK